ncbi:hypothetical protein [Methylophilus aquaticus]|uniref:DUF4148 domain-containing protein n=1 Tax=Methylophilus aquaticus TaxID=1971610 RepID=A0ABT9JUJ3_9PROT|nr:hypothetical protein [Methylophilus aquaticus]MDP8568248.1 hypothetical protein [Methylophilus aquaticus]
MNKLLLAVLSVGLVAQVQAGDLSDQKQGVRSQHQHNFFGQRPYNVAPAEKSNGANQAWEGTGLVTQDPEQAEKALMKHNQHQMNFIGKRPYLAPRNTD